MFGWLRERAAACYRWPRFRWPSGCCKNNFWFSSLSLESARHDGRGRSAKPRMFVNSSVTFSSVPQILHKVGFYVSSLNRFARSRIFSVSSVTFSSVPYYFIKWPLGPLCPALRSLAYSRRFIRYVFVGTALLHKVALSSAFSEYFARSRIPVISSVTFLSVPCCFIKWPFVPLLLNVSLARVFSPFCPLRRLSSVPDFLTKCSSLGLISFRVGVVVKLPIF